MKRYNDILINAVRARLHDNEKTVFTKDQIDEYLLNSEFQLDLFDIPVMEKNYGLLIQGAVCNALAAKALIERGREFEQIDDGVVFRPPNVSDILMTQWQIELSNYMEKIRILKQV